MSKNIKKITHGINLLHGVAMIAAIAYVLSWIIGLSLNTPIHSLSLNATSQQITNAFAGHQTAVALQFGFTEVVAGLMLAIMVLAVATLARKAGAKQSSQLLLITGLTTATLSIVMGMLGLWLIYFIIPGGDTTNIQQIYNIINRIDGPKMWLLAAMALSSIGLAAHGVIPIWLKYVGIALAVALLFSGIAYGLLINNFAWTAYISGVLLLFWVGAVGITAQAETK
ncbi:MAG: hypothetical protein HY034_01500 [Nitrospirae bacterium]|nr:hypothetical protein [Nitrospirota bacterium]